MITVLTQIGSRWAKIRCVWLILQSLKNANCSSNQNNTTHTSTQTTHDKLPTMHNALIALFHKESFFLILALSNHWYTVWKMHKKTTRQHITVDVNADVKGDKM